MFETTSDALALDPLGPMATDSIADDHTSSDPLALDPLSPVDSTRDPTRHLPGREQAGPDAKVTT
jgi:hypothetical protein